jgi:thioredoxin 1
VSALIEQNPTYAKVKIIRVDWDQHAGSPVTRELKVPRRSTLVAFKDGKEQHRVVSGTSSSQLNALFTAVL